MLKQLHIENYILISHLDIALSENLNIITGETGAGKSILLGAISLIMGGKADVAVLKDKSKKSILEAVFNATELKDVLKPIFQQEDIEFESEMTIRRVIAPTGKSKFFVNEEPVSIGFLRSVGELLIDIHSQHQTLLLGSIDFQIGVLDSIANNSTNIEKYSAAYAELKKAESKLVELNNLSLQSKSDEDYLTFQYNQLRDAKLSADEFEQMNTRYQFLANAQMISENMFEAVNVLSQEDNSLLSKISSVKSAIAKVAEFVPNSEDYLSRIESVYIEMKDINSECESVLENVSGDPAELEHISAKLDNINSLQMKHKVSSVEELIELMNGFEEKLDLIGNFDMRISEAENLVKQCSEKAFEIAEKLSENRLKSRAKLEDFVVGMLNNLGMPNSALQVCVDRGESLTKYGIDKVEFLFSANKGVKCEPISKVASGGEMSRLMLSLKALISSSHNMPTLIFDEIDSGVSGKVADKMGEIIMDMASKRQIINITHLPQVAAKGDTHLFVYKEHGDTETVTNIRKLTAAERVTEIASMLSGEKTTESAISQAQELLKCDAHSD